MIDTLLYASSERDTSSLRGIAISLGQLLPPPKVDRLLPSAVKGDGLLPQGLQGEIQLLLKWDSNFLPQRDGLLASGLQGYRHLSLEEDRHLIPKVDRLLPQGLAGYRLLPHGLSGTDTSASRGIATSSLRGMDSFLQARREIDTSLLSKIGVTSLR